MSRIRFGLILLLSVGLLGCGSKNKNAPASVSGKVTYKGAPVTGGNITFCAADSEVSYPGALRADGTYGVSDIPTGAMVVTVETESINPAKKAPSYGGGRGAGSPPPPGAGTGSPGTYVKIPAKYSKKKTSTLNFTTKAGKQTYDIDLTD